MATILVVDDEQEISEAIRLILEDEGHQVETCANGKQALEWLAKGSDVDLVISDVMMPWMSGLELLENIRKTREGGKPPVILMSGVNPTRSRSEARWNEFIKKPFNLDALMGAVNRLLGR